MAEAPVFLSETFDAEPNALHLKSLTISVGTPERASAAEYFVGVTLLSRSDSGQEFALSLRVSGATAVRAMGQALLVYDRLIAFESRRVSLRHRGTGESLDVERHAAIPERLFKRELSTREAMQEAADVSLASARITEKIAQEALRKRRGGLL